MEHFLFRYFFLCFSVREKLVMIRFALMVHFTPLVSFFFEGWWKAGGRMVRGFVRGLWELGVMAGRNGPVDWR